ncbi:unnamed protein product [Caenorhabditis brenneri]
MHKIIFFCVVVSCLLVSNVFCGTEYHFEFYTRFICNRPGFEVKAQFFDKDEFYFNGDDQITEQHVEKSLSGKMFFKEKGMLTGDEWLSDYFNVKMVLYHTCNSNGEEQQADVHLEPLFDIPKSSYTKYYQYHMVLDITNLEGEKTYRGHLTQN